jgi:hypothetical protein
VNCSGLQAGLENQSYQGWYLDRHLRSPQKNETFQCASSSKVTEQQRSLTEQRFDNRFTRTGFLWK